MFAFYWIVSFLFTTATKYFNVQWWSQCCFRLVSPEKKSILGNSVTLFACESGQRYDECYLCIQYVIPFSSLQKSRWNTNLYKNTDPETDNLCLISFDLPLLLFKSESLSAVVTTTEQWTLMIAIRLVRTLSCLEPFECFALIVLDILWYLRNVWRNC